MTDKLRFYLQLMSYFTLTLVGISLITVFYWTIKEYKPIEFNQTPFEVKSKTVKRGEHLVYTVDYCKNSKVEPTVSKSFIDGVIYQIPFDSQPFLEEGCHKLDFQVYIPKALPPSKYKIVFSYIFQVNPIKEIKINSETVIFEVI